MTTTDIKRKIAELLGKSFQAFGSYKTKDGAEFKVEEKMEVGTPIYVITPEGELPVMDGEYELESGMMLKVKEGIVDAIENAAIDGGVAIDETTDEENGPQEFDEATLVDGTTIGTDGDFEVGKKLYVKDEAGDWVQAPEGEHSTDTMTIVVNGEGTITGLKKEGEAGEGSLAEMMALFSDALTTLTGEITTLRNEQKDLKEKFNKIAGSPAGERVFSSYSKTEAGEVDVKASRLAALAEFQKNKRKH
jgi:hypothetical protein